MGTGRRSILSGAGSADSEGRKEGLVERVVENLLPKQPKEAADVADGSPPPEELHRFHFGYQRKHFNIVLPA